MQALTVHVAKYRHVLAKCSSLNIIPTPVKTVM